MVTPRRLKLASVLGCLVLCMLEPLFVSGRDDGEDEIIEPFFAGGRHLLQDQTPCTHQWGGDNFTVLTENCPFVVTANYDTKRCCQDGLGGMLCPYLSLVSDHTTNCAQTFFATLQLAVPNYTTNFFQTICTDLNSPGGIECPAKFINNTGSSPSANFAPRPHPFGLSLLTLVAILEILVLIF